MPKIERDLDREREIMAKLEMRLGPVKREGQHQSDGISCNVKVWGIDKLTEAGVELHFDDEAILKMTLGTLWGTLLEEGEVSQIPVLSMDDESVGTIDIWRGFVVDVKSTDYSTAKDITEIDHWMMQLAGYIYRNMRPNAKSAKAELWVIHNKGDHGKMQCPDHGYPESDVKALYEPTGRQRKICPECREFLVAGNRDPALRVYSMVWPRAELESMHRIITWRLAENEKDKADPRYVIGHPPEIKWGNDFECPNCIVKELIGCPGRGDPNVEQQLEGSLAAQGVNVNELLEKEYAS